MRIERRHHGKLRVALVLFLMLEVIGGDPRDAAAQKTKPIAVSTTTGLNFGTFTMAGTGGSVTVSAAGVRTTTGGVIGMVGGTIAAATFSVTGNNNTPYVITLPTSTVLSGPSGTMPIAFSAALVTGGSLNRTLVQGGKDTFSVGATLTVASNQTPGAYSGSFVMTVNY